MENQNNQNSEKFEPKKLVEDLKTISAELKKQVEILNTGNYIINNNVENTKKLVDESIDGFKSSIKDINIGISPEDVKKMESYKDYFKHYKPVFYGSLFILFCCLGLTVFGGYSGFKYYKESVRTKQEIRGQILQEINDEGNVIVDRKQWENNKENIRLINSWQKSNPKDGESLSNYIKGYQDFKKGKK